MDPKVLRKLEKVAPVTVVAGNLDDPKVMGELPREIADQVDGVRFVVGHKPKRLLNRLVRGKLSLRTTTSSCGVTSTSRRRRGSTACCT